MSLLKCAAVILVLALALIFFDVHLTNSRTAEESQKQLEMNRRYAERAGRR